MKMLLTFLKPSSALPTASDTYLPLWIIWRLEDALSLAPCEEAHLANITAMSSQ